MVLAAVEVSPVGSKPPDVVVRISKGEKHDLSATVPFPTTTLSLQVRAGGSTFTPKLVDHIGAGSTRFTGQLSPRIVYIALAAPYVRSRVLASSCPSASMAKHDCQTSCSRLPGRRSVALISISPSILSRRSLLCFRSLSNPSLEIRY